MERREEQPMNTYEPMAGENISTTAERMIALAKETKGSVTAKFNDIELMATEDSTAEDIVGGFQTKIAESSGKYRTPPERKRTVREREERKEEAQRKAD